MIQITSRERLTTLSFNIDTNIVRAEEGFARTSHPDWLANNRQGKIQTLITSLAKENSPDLVHIQECRKFVNKFGQEVDSLTSLQACLEKLGYKVLTQPYNKAGGDKAFQYITAYNPEKLDLKSSYIRFFTETPDSATPRDTMSDSEIKNHNYGAFWERGAFINHFTFKKTGETIASINVHLDVAYRVKFESCSKLLGFSKEVLLSATKLIMTGDFNTFPDSSDELLEMFSSFQLEDNSQELSLNSQRPSAQCLFETTKSLTFPNGTSAEFTCVPFPYDFIINNFPVYKTDIMEKILDPKERRDQINSFYSESCQATSGILDRVFTYGFEISESVAIPYGLFEPLVSYTREDIKKYVVSHLNPINEDAYGPTFASDHLPVITTDLTTAYVAGCIVMDADSLSSLNSSMQSGTYITHSSLARDINPIIGNYFKKHIALVIDLEFILLGTVYVVAVILSLFIAGHIKSYSKHLIFWKFATFLIPIITLLVFFIWYTINRAKNKTKKGLVVDTGVTQKFCSEDYLEMGYLEKTNQTNNRKDKT